MSRCAAWFVGTTALIWAGTGAMIANDVSGGSIGQTGIALVFGLGVMTMVYALGEISGTHLNPAVSLGFWAARRLSLREVGWYALSQLAGALAASLAWKVVYPTHATLGATVPTVTPAKAFAVEGMLAFLLMLVIIPVAVGAKERGLMAGVAVGGIVALEAIFAGPITGGSMNPARSLAPAVVSGDLSQICIYLTAPFVGAILAVLCCRLLRAEGCCVGVAGAECLDEV